MFIGKVFAGKDNNVHIEDTHNHRLSTMHVCPNTFVMSLIFQRFETPRKRRNKQNVIIILKDGEESCSSHKYAEKFNLLKFCYTHILKHNYHSYMGIHYRKAKQPVSSHLNTFFLNSCTIYKLNNFDFNFCGVFSNFI